MPACVESRLVLLKSHQNPDGGWGYFPGKDSWLEPTAYALMALAAGSRDQSFERGWERVRSWQRRDGAWRPCTQVDQPHWATSLVVTLHCLLGAYDDAFLRGTGWLLGSTGSETGLISRAAHLLSPSMVDFDPGFGGWPWHADNSSWIEPTAHALIALKRARPHYPGGGLTERVAEGERMLLERRCSDGGWNYGNRLVLRQDLPSYPETTALALLALDGNGSLDWQAALAHAGAMRRETRSRLGRAWLSACLIHFHVSASQPHLADIAPAAPDPAPDIVLTSIEALACLRILA
jgi:hypothetical protein